MFWSGLIAFLLFAGAVFGQSAVDLRFTVTFPRSGKVSAAVYDSNDQMIRSLAYAKDVEKGPATFIWDGTTDLGLAADPGLYHLKAVQFDEAPQLSYVMKVGISGTPPYLTDSPGSGWGATHGPAEGVCSNGDKIAAVFQMAESPRETGIQVMDQDGKVERWFSSPFPFDERLACAMDKDALYVVSKVWWRPPFRLVVMKFDLDKPVNGVGSGKVLCDLPAGDRKSTSGVDTGRWIVQVNGMAVNNGRLYIPVRYDDKLFQVDVSTGKIVSEGDVPSPGGVALAGGRIFAVSGKTVVTLDADGNAGPAVLKGLEAPDGLGGDAEGRLYVANRGAVQQVEVFNSNGRLIRRIGIKGGRPRDGIFDPKGLLDPHEIALGPDGRIWITEIAEDFEILSVWRQDGHPDEKFYNMHWSSGQGRMTADHKEVVFGARAGEANAGATSYRVDLKRGTWSPYWHVGIPLEAMDQREVLLGYRPDQAHRAVFRDHEPYLGVEKDVVTATNGRTYLVGGDLSLWLLDEQTKTAKLASLIYMHHVEKTGGGPYQGNYDQGKPNWLTWSDLNGDGKMSLGETNVAERPEPLDGVANVLSFSVTPDLSVWMLVGHSMHSNIYISDRWSVCRLRPVEISKNGVPIYDWSKIEKVTDLRIPSFAGGDGDSDRKVKRVNARTIAIDGEEARTLLEPEPAVRQHLSGIDGDGWWASRNWRITPETFSLKTGNPKWLKLGRRAPGHARPGEMYYPNQSAGSSHGVEFYADTLSQVWAWTDDGLYLGPVYNDNAGANHFDQNSIFVELVGAFVYDTGDKTYLLGGDHGIMVHEIHFPQMLRIKSDVVALTPSQSSAAKPWDPDGPPPSKRPVYIARSIFNFDRGQQRNTRTMTIDGKLDDREWKDVPKMVIKEQGIEVATVQLTFDRSTLYLGYTVHDPNHGRNDGHELPLAPFATGAYGDFDLGPNWLTPQRQADVEGDVRVVMARTPDGNYAMGFWPIKRELKSVSRGRGMNPQDLVSPVAERHFDDVSPLDGFKQAYADFDGGYTLEVSVPFASLGIDVERQTEAGFDASVAFGDASGSTRAVAVHWSGETEGAVVDRPGSAELKPRTWGTLMFDYNPLPTDP